MKNNDFDLRFIGELLERIEKAVLAQRKALNLKAACEYTGFSRSTLYKLTSAGLIPYSKPNGKNLFFDRERLDAWLLSNQNMSAVEKDALAATYVSSRKP